MNIKNFLKILFKTDKMKLTEVQEKIDRVSKDKNILINSPCGSGKTEVSYYISYLWNKKTIYSYPMKSLASSIHQRLNDYEKAINSENLWTIQHSSDNQDKFLKNKKCVTTIDQILSGYLGIGVQSFIKGKNIVDSNFIFDEIQLYDPKKTLKTLICMLDALKEKNNRFVIMTATMPNFLISFLADRYNMEVVIADKPSIKNRKVQLKYIEKIDFDIINSFNKKQIIICNSQKEQEEIFSGIIDKKRVIIVNNKLLKDDRMKVEKEIFKYFGKESSENNKILISTQIIEAGMDISSPRIFSSLAPIDNLIQREGRVCRWGGEGEFIVFQGFYDIYDKEVCEKTLDKIKESSGLNFSLDIQRAWLDEILNPFYEKYINEKAMKVFKLEIGDGNRNDLIRSIESINIIVSDTVLIDDFKREKVSISRNLLKKLSKSNDIYVLEKGNVKETKYFSVRNGETVLIKGNNCIYDNLGFRYEEGRKAEAFPILETEKNRILFEDYIEERWIDHAREVKRVFKEKLEGNNLFNLKDSEMERLSVIAGLHDLGKLNTKFYRFIGSKNEPLAHNVFIPRNTNLIKGLKHNLVSALSLKEDLTKFEFNLILNHHGRVMPCNTTTFIDEFQFVDGYEKLMKDIGYLEVIKKENNAMGFLDKNLMTPVDKDWIEFVYIEGILMESDVQAIKNVKERISKDSKPLL